MDHIRLEYAQKVSDRHRNGWSVGDWTDDTDQMIVLMQCIRKPFQRVRDTTEPFTAAHFSSVIELSLFPGVCLRNRTLLEAVGVARLSGAWRYVWLRVGFDHPPRHETPAVRQRSHPSKRRSTSIIIKNCISIISCFSPEGGQGHLGAHRM